MLRALKIVLYVTFCLWIFLTSGLTESGVILLTFIGFRVGS